MVSEAVNSSGKPCFAAARRDFNLNVNRQQDLMAENF
jgi:hypothetical protein